MSERGSERGATHGREKVLDLSTSILISLDCYWCWKEEADFRMYGCLRDCLDDSG